MKKLGILLIVLLVSILAACGSNEQENNQAIDDKKDSEPFTIGVIPVQTEGEIDEAMTKLQDELSSKLDRDVEITTFPDYNGVVEAMNYNQIDMAYFGPLTYVIAHEKSGAKAIVTQLIDGEPFYHSYIITNTENKWDTLEAFLAESESKRFAFGDPNSTSGSLIPSIELQDRGVFEDQEKNSFKSVKYTGSHDATALSVQNNQVDAGAIDSAIYNQLLESGKIDGDKLKVIWESDKLFQYPWAVAKETDEETIDQLQDAFLSIEDETILNAFGASGFTKASNDDYESIRQAAEKQGLLNQ
ncbi:phosphate/phosphite/phosphonate ABC transporter substrate-binding protein [Pseudalkalibacillus hwajinpoensis]|uniref:Phosphate/phosphite/phosphonate ABC transporter substrate-binding protein n=1 Tax=Guptibacillus hwajinpoensis TaxID=208199 RepID=A0A4U1MLQ7_9BACL|nr:phosphate/phosphite/phosphonate ABC transporter substrate-binding protein [Pseudalkalibacillus hwajinpoensis]TKD71586.1 phosphate/phosphite/phosphonate ABC transporter substrate-binding protein [Pseudalkalibacillus hwajinpoensis]